MSVFVFIVGGALLTAGCGGKGTVAGTVKYKGTPIPSGTIMFTPESGVGLINAPITDGKYAADNVPTGTAKVTVTSMYTPRNSNPMMGPKGKGKMTPPADAPPEARKAFEKKTEYKKGLKIPDKYADPEQSGLTYTVQSGMQTKDFNLE
jgi:hypothetical protein